MKTKFSFSKKPRTSIVRRNPHRKNVNLSPFRLPSFLGITMGVLILIAMAAPSAHAALLTYYDFEDQNFTSDSPGLQTTNIFIVTPNIGIGAPGTNVNAVTTSTNFALVTIPVSVPSDAGFGLGGLTTTGLTDVNLSFALASAGLGSFTTLNLFYSTDGGVTYSAQPFATDTNLKTYTTYTTLSFDVSALTGGAVEGISGSNLFFGFVFSGATDITGGSATFIDNIKVTAVPEPTTWIGGALGFPFIVFVYIQRRRRAQMLRRA
jgi:hypothetical protein